MTDRNDLIADVAMLISIAEQNGFLEALPPGLVARCIDARVATDITVDWAWRDAGGKWWSNQAHGLRVGDWLLCWIDTRPSGGGVEGETLMQIDSCEEAEEFLRELIEDHQWGGDEVKFLGTYYHQSTW